MLKYLTIPTFILLALLSTKTYAASPQEMFSTMHAGLSMAWGYQNNCVEKTEEEEVTPELTLLFGNTQILYTTIADHFMSEVKDMDLTKEEKEKLVKERLDYIHNQSKKNVDNFFEKNACNSEEVQNIKPSYDYYTKNHPSKIFEMMQKTAKENESPKN